MPEDLSTLKPPPVANPPAAPSPAPHFYDDMSQKELCTLRRQRGYPRRGARSLLITLLLTMDPIERKRALGDPEADSSATKKDSVLAVLRSVFVVGKDVVRHRGQPRGPVTRERCAAIPSSLVNGVDEAISEWTADLCGKTLAKELLQEGRRKYASSGKVAQGCELAASGERGAPHPAAQATIEGTIVNTR